MAAIIQRKRRHSRKQALKTGVLTVNGAGRGFQKDEAEKNGDLLAVLVCGFSILALLIGFLGSY